MSLKIFTIALVAAIGISHGLPAFQNPDAEVFNTFPGDLPDFNRPGMNDWGWFSLPDFHTIQNYINQIRATIAETLAGASQGIDLSKGNTTSETKIIDGNRVVINRTEYNENGVHVIVKNVEVQSLDNDNSTEAIRSGTNSTPPSREDIETFGERDAQDNEHLENLDDVDFVPLKTDNKLDIEENMDEYPVEYDLSKDIDVNKITKPVYNDDVEVSNVNSIINPRPLLYQSIKVPKSLQRTNINKEQNTDDIKEVFHDLSGDTYVNDLLARKDESSDWEHFPRAHMHPRPSPRLSHSEYQVFPEDISRYRDLSHDTHVNEVAAQRRMPKNPDAEEFDVETFNPHVATTNALRKRYS